METLRVDGLSGSYESDSKNLLIFLSLTPALPVQHERHDYKNEQKVICAQNISFHREKDRTLFTFYSLPLSHMFCFALFSGKIKKHHRSFYFSDCRI